ncbi:MAG: amino acid adenylation domain-containing protein [Thiohalocapsa sp.]
MSPSADAAMTPLQQAVVALQAQRTRIAALEAAATAPIAVIGMGCRYPADAGSPAAMWQALRVGRDGSREVPQDRWDIDAVYDPTPGRPGKMYVRNSCFIAEVDRFEPLFFRISPREAIGIDPQQRLLLEVTWEALEDAAIPPPSLVGSQTGVFVGISTNDYSALLSRTAHGSGSNATAGAGNAASVASGRLSYTFGFQGPCLAVDTACSSSLVATHLAVQALRNNECGLAVVAGVNLMLTPDITVNFCQGRMLSPDGHCKSFDASADGYVRGEGCGVLILKRLAEAEADGDRILAVIRGSAVNQDGRSAGLTAPNGLAQEVVIRRALANAGMRPEEIDYIEAHGTGTALGDPIEMHALKAVFGERDKPLWVGSVKTNIGHAEAAAGAAGLVKAVLMLQHQALPPNLHFRRLNPHIDLDGVDIRVPTAFAQAPLLGIGVSSFGFSGTNAHIVLAPATPALGPAAGAMPHSAPAPVLFLSGRTREALVALIERYRAYLAATSDSFADICHTAAVGRARLPWWVAVSDPAALGQAEPSNAPPPPLPATGGRKVALPTVAFQRERCWIDTALAEAPVPSLDSGEHPLLGARLALPLAREKRWQSVLTSAHPLLGFLAEHRVDDHLVLPASCLVEMMLSASPGYALGGLSLAAPLPLDDPPARLVQTIVGDDATVRIVSCAADGGDAPATVHASARLVALPAATAIPVEQGGTPLDAESLYAAMAARGVSHGAAFRLLDRIRHGDGFASALLRKASDEARFTIHPARLDAAFQLVAAALPDSGSDILLPAEIGTLVVHRAPAADAQVQAVARYDGASVTADIVICDDAGVAVEIGGLVFRALRPAPAADGFYRPDWRKLPLLDGLAPPVFLPPAERIAAVLDDEGRELAARHGMEAYAASEAGLERAATGYVVRALEALGLDLQPGREFTFGATAESLGIEERHHRLLRRLLAMLQEDGVLAGSGRRWRVLRAPPPADPQADIDALLRAAPAMAGEIAVLRRCGEALAGVLTGRVEPLGLLFPAEGEGAGAFYETSPYARTVNGLLNAAGRQLTAVLPPGRVLRVLEAGAGTGGATGALLDALPPAARHYVFTDISAGFLAAAQRKFAGAALETREFDIERPPSEQGFSARSFDVVLAANVLHATRDIRQALRHIAELLAPGGTLLLVESTVRRRWVDIVFGLSEGWWRFADAELRPDHPLLPLPLWQEALTECGFEVPQEMGGEVIVASRRADPPHTADGWHIAGASLVLRHLPAHLQVAGMQLMPPETARHWLEILPPAEPEEEAQVALLLHLLATARAAAAAPGRPDLTFVADCSLGHAGVAGFVRTLALEMPDLRPRLLVAPPSETALLDELVARDEREIGWDDDGRRQVRRLVPAAVPARPAKIAGTWLITGARGGVAQTLTARLAEEGADALVLLSRELPAAPAGIAIPVHRYAGDAADAALVAELCRRHAVTGIMHATGLLADAAIGEQSEADVRAVLHAKIGGAVALDRASRSLPLAQFVLCASAAGVLGSARQANHAFASAFLDALAEERRREGQPGLSLDWGVWREVGSAASLGFDAQAERLGLGTLGPEQGARLFARGLAAAEPQLLVLPSVDWRQFTAHFDDGVPALLREVAAAPPPQLAAPPPSPTPDVKPDIETALADIVRQALGLSGPVDREAPLNDLGLDSLVAVEIRNRLERELGLVVSVRELIEGASLRSLVEAAQSTAPAAPTADRGQLVPDFANRYAPFPLTDMQQAYWLGRRSDLALGSVACYLYTEFDTAQVDLDRAEAAWNRLVARHDMLRVLIRADGTQQILREVPYYRFERLDLRGRDAEQELEERRQRLAARVADPGSWPLFDIRVSLLDDRFRLHMGFDLIALDAASIHALRREWGLLYDDPGAALPPIGLSFRDVVMAQIARRDSVEWRRHAAYWQERAKSLPGAPGLPVVGDATRVAAGGFRRRGVIVDAEQAAALRGQAQAHGLTLPALLAAAYADILAAWSSTAQFCLTVTSFNRPDLHPDIAAVLGDFTSTILLEVDARGASFAERAAALARQLGADLEHAEIGGIEVLREIARQGGGATAVPVVFTSAIGFRRGSEAARSAASDSGGWDRLGQTVFSVSSTPQVLIDHQISEEDGRLFCNWDAAEDMFPPGTLDQMVAAYRHLLAALADDAGWQRPVAAALPALARPRFTPVPADELLQAAFERQAAQTPRRVALIAPDHELDYATLDDAATHLAAALAPRLGSARRDRLVAIGFAKGWHQIVAVLAVLKAGAVYLPLDPALPEARRRLLVEQSGAVMLDDPALADAALALAREGAIGALPPPVDDPSRLAYVIYTSGSTGTPKGVMIEHRAALSTIGEVNRRWQVGPDDRTLGLSSLSFDLSVYDIFGPLSVGGALVLPAPADARDPSRWADLITRHDVTIWNSVPALMAMQAEYGLPPDHRLRLVLLSGDWVPVELVPRLRLQMPRVRLVALGGATEAAIWSNAHELGELDPEWRSIPYGLPLAGHMLHIVSERGEDCPDWVVGEIEISGQGLARGYLGDVAQTAERFRIDPQTGERRYRTGDLGRFRPYGAMPAGAAPGMPPPIEFLGRADTQVKVQGYRIELGEVEAALASHTAVAQAIAVAPAAAQGAAHGSASGRDRTLHAFVVPCEGGTALGAIDTEWRALVGAAELASGDAARQVARDEFELTAATFTDQAAAAAAAALRRLTGSYELPDEETLIRDHGVAPRYRHWLARMLPEVARVGMAAEPQSSHSISGVDRLGFGPASLDFLDRVIARLPDILTEREHSSAIYLDGETPEVYARLFAAPNAAIAAALRALAGEREPGEPLTVLEVGGGLGTTLAAIEPALPKDRLSYLFTDVSQHLLRTAMANFADRPWLAFATLDLDQPMRQYAGRFDAVVAASAVHAAPDVARALAHLRTWLKPGGVLLLLEETRFFPWFDLGMGLQLGFDARRDLPLRPLHPLLSREAWRQQLTAAGFDRVALTGSPGAVEERLGFDLILARNGIAAAAAADDDLPARLTAYLRERLPSYMLPQTIGVIDRLPLSANGKVDRAALAAMVRPAAGPHRGADRLQGEVAAAVAGLMQLDRVDPRRSLFEFGATSLTLVSVQRLLGERFGRVVPLQRIFEAPTVAGFAAALADHGMKSSPLVRFTAAAGDDHRPALITMPGIFALPFYLRELAAAVADELAVVSVQLPGLADGESPIDTVEGQAAYVVTALREARLPPPYLLAGHSFGGLVAIEAARLLRQAGEPAALLALGDTVRTTSTFAELQSDELAYTAMTRGLLALYGSALPAEAGLVALPPAERFQQVAARLQESGLFGALQLPFERMAAVFKANFRALGSYRPMAIVDDIALIRTEGGFPPELQDFESGEALRDPGLGWSALAQGRLDITMMPGDHLSMLDPAHLAALAAILRRLAAAALARCLHERFGIAADPDASPRALYREIRNRQAAPGPVGPPRMSLAADGK